MLTAPLRLLARESVRRPADVLFLAGCAASVIAYRRGSARTLALSGTLTDAADALTRLERAWAAAPSAS